MALSIDKIMQAGFGLTGKGESFVKLNNKPAKKYNAERYAEAYAALRADEHAQVAEAALMRIEVIKMKARGESDNKILNKVKNAGKDIWRTVKALIGKVIIIIEEFIAKLTSKVKPARKLAESLKDYSDKIGSGAPYKDSVTKITVEAYGIDPQGWQKKYTVDLDDTKQQMAFLKVMANATKKKADAIKGAFKDLKNQGANTVKDGSVPGDFNSTGNLDSSISEAINLGITLEKEESKLAQIKKASVNSLKGAKETTDFSTDRKTFVELLNKTAKTIEELAEDVEYMNTSISVVKTFLNKLKNAPTSVTENASAEELQFVRLMCTRANKALNVNRQACNVRLAKYIKIGAALVKSAKKVLKSLDYKENKLGNKVTID